MKSACPPQHTLYTVNRPGNNGHGAGFGWPARRRSLRSWGRRVPTVGDWLGKYSYHRAGSGLRGLGALRFAHPHFPMAGKKGFQGAAWSSQGRAHSAFIADPLRRVRAAYAGRRGKWGGDGCRFGKPQPAGFGAHKRRVGSALRGNCALFAHVGVPISSSMTVTNRVALWIASCASSAVMRVAGSVL